MARETEIKLHVKDLPALRRTLRKLGAQPVFAGTRRVHEWNVIFDTENKDLAARKQLLRIRTETGARSDSKPRRAKAGRVLVTFKRPIGSGTATTDSRRLGRHKSLEEIELDVTDARALTQIFEALGLTAWFRYEKYRTTYRLPPAQRWARKLLIELDQTPIGTFLELEGPAASIDRAATALGFTKQDYIVTNYLSLYREECRKRGVPTGDMVFQKR